MYEKYYNVKVDDKEEIVLQKDGDSFNFDKDNLMLIHRKATTGLGGYIGNYGKDKRTMLMLMSEIKTLAKEMK